MILKKIITISLITTTGLTILILIAGLLIPESVLLKLSRSNSTGSVSTISEDGKLITETVDEATGEKTVTITDPETGKTVTNIVNSNGEVIKTKDENGNTSTATSNTTKTGQTTTSTTKTSTGGSTSTTSSPGAPVISLSVSPSTITKGASATLGWSATNSPSSCTASGGWSGSKATSGSQGISPQSTTTYTLTCKNSGGTGSKSVSITVNTPVAACGQPGGTCKSSDITPYNSAGNCRSAINASGSGLKAYAIPSSFLSLHQPEKGITSQLCGKTYGSNLRNADGKHQNGSTLGGQNYDQWMNNMYLGPYSN